MRKLALVNATPEQLPIISAQRMGAEVIRGAAGSGKTSTALLRMQSLKFMIEARKSRLDDPTPVRILVLTFNRTLSGYVSSLAEAQRHAGSNAIVEISTFAKWAVGLLPGRVLDAAAASGLLLGLIQGASVSGLAQDYLVDEIDYVMGRFAIADLESYIDCERTGRGQMPRVVASARRLILDQVVYPYIAELEARNMMDWNTLATEVLSELNGDSYDVVVVDEAQDFSANQLRAVMSSLKEVHAATFVIDTAQRIYARGFTWAEAGVNVTPGAFYRLLDNHRNTVQIASFVSSLLARVSIDNDGAMPDLNRAYRGGSLPYILEGEYPDQVAWAINFIKGLGLSEVSVGFLAPLGGGWLTYLKNRLVKAGIDFVDITRNPEWPEGGENVAICTFNSAKGLEFDHVFILGLCEKNAGLGVPGHDDKEERMRRLFAVACARAKDTLAIGYLPSEASFLMQGIDRSLVQEIIL